MRLEQVAAAASLDHMRRDLLVRRSEAEQALGVTLRGAYQDEQMLTAVRPSVLAEIDRRLADCHARMRALGVEVHD